MCVCESERVKETHTGSFPVAALPQADLGFGKVAFVIHDNTVQSPYI